MLPDISRATTISTPLAVTLVSLLVRRGWASAKMSNVSVSQRKAATKPPVRFRLMLTTPRSNCTEE